MVVSPICLFCVWSVTKVFLRAFSRPVVWVARLATLCLLTAEFVDTTRVLSFPDRLSVLADTVFFVSNLAEKLWLDNLLVPLRADWVDAEVDGLEDDACRELVGGAACAGTKTGAGTDGNWAGSAAIGFWLTGGVRVTVSGCGILSGLYFG